MDIFTAITTRRSTRSYIDRPVEFDKLTAMLEAGIWAPSAGNLQNWRFILVTDKEKIENISHYCPNQNFVFQAPVLIVVLSDNARVEKYYGAFGKFWGTQSVAACIQNMLLCATALNLGTCWVGAFDAMAIADMLDIPEDMKLHAILTVGYSDEKHEEPARDPLEGATFFNTYGNKYTNTHLYLGQYSEEIKQKKTEATDALSRMGRDYGEVVKGLFGKIKEKVQNKK